MMFVTSENPNAATRVASVSETELTRLGISRACGPSANRWVSENGIRVTNVETVVLPNIWSRYEEGSSDTVLGTSGESPSFWHQFIRVWYQE